MWLQVRQCPETGHEELVVLAGYCNNVLADMNPYRLDLTTWQWWREPGLVPNPGPGDALKLPMPRQRAAADVVGKKWLLLLGGSPTQVHVVPTQRVRYPTQGCLGQPGTSIKQPVHGSVYILNLILNSWRHVNGTLTPLVKSCWL